MVLAALCATPLLAQPEAGIGLPVACTGRGGTWFESSAGDFYFYERAFYCTCMNAAGEVKLKSELKVAAVAVLSLRSRIDGCELLIIAGYFLLPTDVGTGPWSFPSLPSYRVFRRCDSLPPGALITVCLASGPLRGSDAAASASFVLELLV
jgi:hypothetical protein